MITIRGLKFDKTSEACPEQYDVFYGETQVGYVRIRFGNLRADYPDCGGETIFCEFFGDAFLGSFESEDQRMKYLKIIADKIWDKMNEEREERKTGHWIVYDVHGHKACKCSECNSDVGYPCTNKYCRHCGTRMRG